MISILFSFIVVFSNPESVVTTCPTPSSVHVSSRASNSILFDWDNDIVFTGDSYKVQYLRLSDNYSSPVYGTVSSNYSFTNMQAGDYVFYFWSVCSETEMSEAIVIEDLIDN